LQDAADSAVNDYDTKGYDIIVNAAEGTYSSGAVVNRPLLGGGKLHFLCNTINGILGAMACAVETTGAAFQAYNGAVIRVAGWRLKAPGGILLTARYAGSQVWFDYVQCDQAAICAYADQFGKFEQTGDLGVLAGGTNLFLVAHLGSGRLSGGGIFFLNDVTYSDSLIWVLTLGDYTITGPTTTMNPPATPFALLGHGVTGPKARIENNAVIQWGSHNCTDLPGSAPPIFLFGGQCQGIPQ
jgi:hypothetical protein